MTLTRFPRPCPIPGHPQEDDPAPLAPDSAWSRLRAWHLHAPAERLPLPLVLTTWPSACGTARRARPRPRRRRDRSGGRADHLADVAAAREDFPASAPGRCRGRHGRRGDRRVGRRRCHVRAARLARAPAVLDLPGRRVFGYRWLRTHEAVRAARARRDDAARWHRPQGRMAPDRAPDRPGRLPPPVGHPDAPRRGAAAHQRPRQRAGYPRGGRAAGRTRRSSRTCGACPTAGSTSGSPSIPASWSSRSARRTRRSAARSPTRRLTRTRRTRTGSRSGAASASPSRSA